MSNVVLPSSEPPKAVNLVLRNRFAFGVSMCMLLNVALMPMKAYLSEDFPWSHLVGNPVSSNFTEFNQTIMELYQQAYNNRTLPLGAVYYKDPLHAVHVVRMALNISTWEPFPRDQCVSSFILGLPGVPFYTEGVYNILCSLAAKNASFWDNRGLCTYDTFFNYYIGHLCVWLASGNDITQLSSLDQVTLYTAFLGYGSLLWFWCKFIYRVFISAFTLRMLWYKYYKHCLHLEKVLVAHGHKGKIPTGQNWTYQVLWGDPTAMVLLHPYIAMAFTIDCWFSVDRIVIAFIQMSQSSDIMVLLMGIVYLSRTVWFAYAGLCLTSTVLKFKRKEHVFSEIDPTLVAIAATINGPIVSWMMSNTSFLLASFHYLFELTVPRQLAGYQFDGSLTSTLYMIIVASLPISWGLLLPLLRKEHQESTEHNYGNYNYNSVKTRLLFHVMHIVQGKAPTNTVSFGGTIYRLFKSNPRYKQCPTISFRSTDCFVYCYNNGKFSEKLRLSLLESLDQNTSNKDLAVQIAKGVSPFAFNVLLPPDDEKPNPQLLLPHSPSPWCFCICILEMPQHSSTKIAPSSSNEQGPSQRIVRNRIAFGVSMIMLVNIAAMPMKAYFSEHPPWSVPYQESFENFTMLNATILREYQVLYSYQHLPKFSSYYDDGDNNTQVMRQVVDMTTSIDAKDCTDLFLAGKPSALFYGLPIRDFLCTFAATNHSNNDSSWNHRGTCVQITYFSSSIGFQCVWTMRGNMLANVSLPNEFTITAIHTISADKTWYCVKFCYRVCITLFVCFLMWTRYYRHCIQLEQILSTDGHRYDNKGKQKELWHYEVVWGDPTPIILMNPYVSLAFFLDCWFSAETISIVIPRASQSDDIYIMLSAFLYLSRTVWFAYAAMCVIASSLKRFHREHAFIEIDPTIVAVATTFFGPVVSWAMGNIGFLLEIYFFLFECFIPPKYQNEQIDGGPPSMLYSISIASMPMLYGFLGGIYRTPIGKFSSSSRFSNVWYNGMKTKVMFLAMKVFQPNQPGTITQYGGSIYRLSTAIPRYKQSPTISFCSSDCFIYCYYNGEMAERIRVTLLASLDRNLKSSAFAVVDAKEESPFCFNSLQVLGPNEMIAPRLLRSRRPTTWCI